MFVVSMLAWPSQARIVLMSTSARTNSQAAVWRLSRQRHSRHTAASQAVMSGENLPLVGKLLGHRRHSTTAGYAHLADAHLVEAAERIGSRIAAIMNG